MYVIDLIPLSYIPIQQPQILSYFFERNLDKGVIVSIKINKKKVFGIVIKSQSFRANKMNLKKGLHFSLKKIIAPISDEVRVSEIQFLIARFISNYYFSPLGLTLKMILPAFLLKKKYKILVDTKYIADTSPITNTIVTHFKERTKEYRLAIEAIINANRQALIVIPDSIMAEYFLEEYRDLKPTYIDSKINNKKYFETWKQIAEGSVVLTIATKKGLFLPFKDLGLIIIDDEANSAYYNELLPYYQTVTISYQIAKYHRSKRILGSSLPRLESFVHIKDTDRNSKNSLKKGFLIDMTKEIRDKNYSIFSLPTQKILLDITQSNAKTLLYIPRKGHSTIINCLVCGKSLTCKNCAIPLAYRIVPRTEIFCGRCHYHATMPQYCPNCNATALKRRGVGIEKVLEELKRFYEFRFLKIPQIVQVDSDSKDTSRDKLFNQQFPIVIGTQSIFSYKYLIKFNNICIINADTLTKMPDFRSEQFLFQDLFNLAELSEDNFIIQTYNPESRVFRYITDHQNENFLKDELRERSLLEYPPFSHIIKITISNRDNGRCAKEAIDTYQRLKSLLDRSKKIILFEPAPAFIAKENNIFRWIILIKIPISSAASIRKIVIDNISKNSKLEFDPKDSV